MDSDECERPGARRDEVLQGCQRPLEEVEREAERLALTYKALGDPTRLKMVMALAGGEMCVCDLAAFLGLTESAVSHHLRRLKDLALVKSRRDGQILYYSLDDEHVSKILKVGLEHIRE